MDDAPACAQGIKRSSRPLVIARAPTYAPTAVCETATQRPRSMQMLCPLRSFDQRRDVPRRLFVRTKDAERTGVSGRDGASKAWMFVLRVEVDTELTRVAEGSNAVL